MHIIKTLLPRINTLLSGALIAAAGLACASPSSAAPVTFDFGGTLTQVSTDLAGLMLSSDALPLDTPALGSAFGRFGLRANTGGNQVELLGDITSLACVSGCIATPDPNPQPNPSTVLAQELVKVGLKGTVKITS